MPSKAVANKSAVKQVNIAKRARKKVRVGIIGVGNCASSFVQGVEYYKNAPTNQMIPGLMHPVLGDYHIGDIEFSAAIDIDVNKVGKDLSEAIKSLPTLLTSISIAALNSISPM